MAIIDLYIIILHCYLSLFVSVSLWHCACCTASGLHNKNKNKTGTNKLRMLQAEALRVGGTDSLTIFVISNISFSNNLIQVNRQDDKRQKRDRKMNKRYRNTGSEVLKEKDEKMLPAVKQVLKLLTIRRDISVCPLNTLRTFHLIYFNLCMCMTGDPRICSMCSGTIKNGTCSALIKLWITNRTAHMCSSGGVASVLSS